MDVIICIIIIISFFIFIPTVKIDNNLTKKLRLIFILAMIIIVGLISKGIIWFPHQSKIPPPLGSSLTVLLIMLVSSPAPSPDEPMSKAEDVAATSASSL